MMTFCSSFVYEVYNFIFFYADEIYGNKRPKNIKVKIKNIERSLERALGELRSKKKKEKNSS